MQAGAEKGGHVVVREVWRVGWRLPEKREWWVLIKRDVMNFIKSKFVGLYEARISGSLYLLDIWLCAQVFSYGFPCMR